MGGKELRYLGEVGEIVEGDYNKNVLYEVLKEVIKYF